MGTETWYQTFVGTMIGSEGSVRNKQSPLRGLKHKRKALGPDVGICPVDNDSRKTINPREGTETTRTSPEAC